MGKAKKLKVSGQTRHAPLGDQIKKDDFAMPSTRPSKERSRTDEEDVDKFVDGKLSGRILSQARQQVKELEAEESSSGVKTWKNQAKLSSHTSATSSDEDSDPDEDDTDVSLPTEGVFDGKGYVGLK